MIQRHILTDNIFTIDDFWSAKECEIFIEKSEAIGYEPATVNTENGPKVITAVRNNNRVIYKDQNLADKLWEKLEPFAPKQIGYSKAVGLNELFRFYKYQPGQEFKRHSDQSFIRNDIEASYFTFMIYLNEDFQGGETTFNGISIKPKKGLAIVFLHSLSHESSPVTEGIKYVLRTDVMFRFNG